MTEVGDVHAFPLRGGRWGALRITRVGKAQLAAEVLDWIGDAVPSLEALGSPGPFQGAWLRAEASPPHASVDRGTVPRHFPRVGNLPREVAEEPAVTMVWDGFPHDLELALRWAATDAGVREHFLTCAGNREATAEVDGAGAVRVSRRRVDLDLRGRAAGYDWSQLDRLGALLVLAVTGPAPGLGAYLATRPLVRHLVWHHPEVGELDLTGAGLDELDLVLDDAGPRRVRVGPELDQLRLRPEDCGRVAVDHPGEGEGVTLRVEACTGEHPGVVPGLARLGGLVIASPRALQVGRVAGYRELHHLWARLGPPGELIDGPRLAELGRLRTLQLDGVYAMDAAGLPDLDAWPELDEVRLDGLRKADAATLKKRWKAAPHLELRGAKDDAWVRANIRNPFRDWADELGTRPAAAACKAYEKACKAAAKKGADAAAVLGALVEALNAVHAKAALDTGHREQAGEAYHGLAAELGVDPAQAAAWFDAGRDF